MRNFLNPRKNNKEADVDAIRNAASFGRVTQAAKTTHLATPPLVALSVSQSAHGFTVGQAVCQVAVSGTWVLASAFTVMAPISGQPTDRIVGVVSAVVTADAFRVCLSGFVTMSDPTWLAAFPTAGVTYYLGPTAGTLVNTIAGTGNAYQPRAVLINHGGNLFELLSPSLAGSHEHNITVRITQASHGFSAGNWLYDTTSGGSGVFALATYALAGNKPVGIVTQVVDANTFDICFKGVLNGSGTSIGYLGTTPGSITSTPGGRAVTFYVDTNRIYVDGLTTLAVPKITLETLTDVTITSPAIGDAVTWDGTKWINYPSAGGGTVTSVGLALPSGELTVSGSPVTATGTLTATWHTQAANTVFAGPVSGGSATPGFRALSMTNGDIADAALNTPTNFDFMVWSSGAGKMINNGMAASNFFAATPASGSTARINVRLIDPRDFPRRYLVSQDLTGSGNADLTFDYTNSYLYFLTTAAAGGYTDRIADPPPTGDHYFKIFWDSSVQFGSDLSGSWTIINTKDTTYRKFAINKDGQVRVILGDATNTFTVTLRLDEILDLAGTVVTPGQTTIDIRPRQIDICVAGVAKKVIGLFSQDY